MQKLASEGWRIAAAHGTRRQAEQNGRLRLVGRQQIHEV